MEHADHVQLIRDGIPGQGGIWADLGSGTGAFTLALADLIGPGGEIYTVDRERGTLRRQERQMQARFPAVTVHYLAADFRRRLDLPPLDGVVMANSLHFVPDKEPLLRLVAGALRPGGRLILVEYNTDQGNPWVPHPLSYPTWQGLAARCGLAGTRLLATHPSRFLGQIYAALSLRPATPVPPDP